MKKKENKDWVQSNLLLTYKREFKDHVWRILSVKAPVRPKIWFRISLHMTSMRKRWKHEQRLKGKQRSDSLLMLQLG